MVTADLRARVRRRRLRVGCAIAALAVVTAAIAIVATLPGTPGVLPGVLTSAAKSPPPNRPPPVGPVAWYPAGPLPPADAGPDAARYFVALEYRQPTVIAWKTDTEIAVVWPPTGGGLFVGVAAAGDDRTFVLEEDGADGQPSAFYELRLRLDGRPLPLTRLAIPASTMAAARSAAVSNPVFDPGGSPGTPTDNSFAISPDGRKLAVAVAVGSQAAIDVVTLATGSVREWSGPGGVQAANAMELGWAGNRCVTFTWWVTGKGAHTVLRLLNTGTGNKLLASRVVVGPFKNLAGIRGTALLGGYSVSPDGSTLFAEYAGPLTVGTPIGTAKVAIIQISVRTGQPVREILPPVHLGIRGPLCGVLWSDPSGRSIVATCGANVESDLEQGIVSDEKLRTLSLDLPGDSVVAYSPNDFLAW